MVELYFRQNKKNTRSTYKNASSSLKTNDIDACWTIYNNDVLII